MVALVVGTHARSVSRAFGLTVSRGGVARRYRKARRGGLLLSSCDQFFAEAFHMVDDCDHIHDQGLDLARLRLLVHILNKVALALNASIGDLTDLFGVEGLPRLVVQVLVEGHDVYGINEIDECVADVAAVVQIQREVEKVVAALVVPVDALQEHLFSVLVGDVPDHDGCSRVLSAQDTVQVDLELWVGVLPTLFAVRCTALGVLRPRCWIEGVAGQGDSH